jgi:hypothetical protein
MLIPLLDFINGIRIAPDTYYWLSVFQTKKVGGYLMSKMYVGDIGTIIILDVGITVASATSYSFKVIKPSGVIQDWTCTVNSTTSFKYATQNGSLNESGIYHIQAYATYPDWNGRSDTISFEVYDLFD